MEELPYGLVVLNTENEELEVLFSLPIYADCPGIPKNKALQKEKAT